MPFLDYPVWGSVRRESWNPSVSKYKRHINIIWFKRVKTLPRIFNFCFSFIFQNTNWSSGSLFHEGGHSLIWRRLVWFSAPWILHSLNDRVHIRDKVCLRVLNNAINKKTFQLRIPANEVCFFLGNFPRWASSCGDEIYYGKLIMVWSFMN